MEIEKKKKKQLSYMDKVPFMCEIPYIDVTMEHGITVYNKSRWNRTQIRKTD